MRLVTTFFPFPGCLLFLFFFLVFNLCSFIFLVAIFHTMQFKNSNVSLPYIKIKKPNVLATRCNPSTQEMKTKESKV